MTTLKTQSINDDRRKNKVNGISFTSVPLSFKVQNKTLMNIESE